MATHGINNMIRSKIMLFLVVLFLPTLAFSQEATTTGDTIKTESTTTSTINSKTDSTTTVKTPPPSAITPQINTSNSDLCTVGIAGAVQTQILGISAGKTIRDMNCEKLKNAKTLYDMGMKVAAVSVMCQDERVFEAMMNAGTPCPYDGKIGVEAKAAWEENQDQMPGNKKKIVDEETKSTLIGGGILGGLLLLLLL